MRQVYIGGCAVCDERLQLSSLNVGEGDEASFFQVLKCG